MFPDRPDAHYHSFVLRLWRADSLGEPAAWQIEVESIQSGQKWHFAELEKVFSFLQGQVTNEAKSETENV